MASGPTPRYGRGELRIQSETPFKNADFRVGDGIPKISINQSSCEYVNIRESVLEVITVCNRDWHIDSQCINAVEFSNLIQ
jgi:hypothetical protein